MTIKQKSWPSWDKTKPVRLDVSLIEKLKKHAKYQETLSDVIIRLLKFRIKKTDQT